jgi:ketosteroid isomerase-like protein
MIAHESHTHLHAFLDAMRAKNADAMLSHMADDMVLRTPLHAEPFRGKAAIRPVVDALLAVVDQFDFREILQGPQHVAVFFAITVGDLHLNGMDYVRLAPSGLLQELTVLWRPLPAVIAVNARLA